MTLYIIEIHSADYNIDKFLICGHECWFLDGMSHRKNMPSFISSSGYKEWFEKNKIIKTSTPYIQSFEAIAKYHEFKYFHSNGCI